MSNSSLSKLIDSALQITNKPCTKQDLLSVIRLFREFSGPLEYNNTSLFVWLIASFLVTVTSAYFMIQSYYAIHWQDNLNINEMNLCLGVAAVGLISTIVICCIVYNRSSKVPDLAGDILYRAGTLNYGLAPLPHSHEVSLRSLQKRFGDFDRGNYSREIQVTFSGVYTGSLHQLKYEYYRFEWVDEREVVVQVSNGKGGTTPIVTKVYDTYHRYCVVADFPWVKNVKVQNDGQTEFKCKLDSAHPGFNKTFNASAANELDGMKFLKPTTILHLQEMASGFGGLNLEFSASGQVCVSFNNSDMLEPFPQGLSLLEPNTMFDAVEAGIDFPHLTKTLDQIHILAEQHDNNFTEPHRVMP
jgi:hypothetical protein